MASVLEGFLVRLGFEVDKDQQAKFKASVEEATARVKTFAMAGVGIGAAFLTGAAKATKSLSKFADFSRINNASVASVSALGTAFETVGGTVEDAQGAISALSKNLSTLPGFAGMLKRQYGVEVFDQNGKQRDTVAIMMDLRKELQKLPEPYARARAAVLGLGSAYDFLMAPNFAKNFSRAVQMGSNWGRGLSEGAKEARKLMTELDLLNSNLKNGLLATFGEFAKENGLSQWLKKLNEQLPATMKTVSDSLRTFVEAGKLMIEESDWFLSWLGKFLFQADDYELLAKKKRGAKLSREEEDRLAALEKRRSMDVSQVAETAAVQRLGIERPEDPDGYALTEEDRVAQAIYAGSPTKVQPPMVEAPKAVQPAQATYSPQKAKAEAGRPVTKTEVSQSITVNTTVNVLGNASSFDARRIANETSKTNAQSLARASISPVR